MVGDFSSVSWLMISTKIPVAVSNGRGIDPEQPVNNHYPAMGAVRVARLQRPSVRNKIRSRGHCAPALPRNLPSAMVNEPNSLTHGDPLLTAMFLKLTERERDAATCVFSHSEAKRTEEINDFIHYSLLDSGYW